MRVLSFFCVLLFFCRSFVVFCFSQSKDKEPKTLCRITVIRNLANSICKPNFRFNNNNWQLWQTTNNHNNNNKNFYNHNNNNYNIMTILEEQSYFNEAGNVSEETAYDSYYTQYTTPDSMDCGSDNLLVTFDYGYSDSIGAPPMPNPMAMPPAATYAEDAEAIWFGTPPNDAKAFKVHHVQHHKHSLPEESLQSLISYDVDDIEELSEPESDEEQESEEAEESEESEEEREEVFYDSIES